MTCDDHEGGPSPGRSRGLGATGPGDAGRCPKRRCRRIRARFWAPGRMHYRTARPESRPGPTPNTSPQEGTRPMDYPFALLAARDLDVRPRSRRTVRGTPSCETLEGRVVLSRVGFGG